MRRKASRRSMFRPKKTFAPAYRLSNGLGRCTPPSRCHPIILQIPPGMLHLMLSVCSSLQTLSLNELSNCRLPNTCQEIILAHACHQTRVNKVPRHPQARKQTSTTGFLARIPQNTHSPQIATPAWAQALVKQSSFHRHFPNAGVVQCPLARARHHLNLNGCFLYMRTPRHILINDFGTCRAPAGQQNHASKLCWRHRLPNMHALGTLDKR